MFRSLPGVEHQDADVGVLDGAYRAHHRVELQILHLLALLAHARRIDQVEVHAVFVVARVDGVARGARYVGHDVALLAQKGVGERRFAHVGASDDGYARQILLHLGFGVFGQSGEDGVHHVARAAARHRADAVGIAQSESVKFVRLVDEFVVVDLVAHHHDLLARASQHVGHHHVEIGDARLDLHHEEDEIGLVDGQHHLTPYVVLEYVVGIDGIASRVDHRKLLAVPVGLAVMTVARGARRGVDYGLALSHQAVEESRFAHVGAAYDSY